MRVRSSDRGHHAPRPVRSQLTLLVGDRRGPVLALAVVSILAGIAEAGSLAVIAQVAAALVNGAKHAHVKLGAFQVHSSVGTLLAVGFALSALRLLLAIPLSTLPARIGADVQARLRRDLFHAFTLASWEVQSRDREGQLQETMTSQVMQATLGVLYAANFITAALTFLVLMVSAVALNVKAAAIVLAVAVLMFALLRPLRLWGYRRSRALSQAQVEYAGAIAEANRVAEETQVFGVAAAQRTRINRFVGVARDLLYRTQVIARLIPNLYQSLLFLLLMAGLAGLYASARSQAASLGAVVLLLLRAAQNGQAVQGSYQAIQQSLPFIERLQDAQRRYADSSAPGGARPLPRIADVAFDDVSYSYYPGQAVLSEITFQVQAGESVGIIGPSGAGKSTLVQILLQLRAPDGGQYLVNGVPVVEYSRADWHRLVSYVPQDPRLVHASVADNIRYYRDLDDDAVERAARLARIHDDVMAWPEGYATIVGPRADAVSGGQQQRICLARALAARPEVLVLDEPTSALDPHSEKLIGESLESLRHELTLFIIAHRMSTLDMCDRVMVVVDGRLVAFDSKALLQRQNPYYRRASQLAAGASGGRLP